MAAAIDGHRDPGHPSEERAPETGNDGSDQSSI